MSVQRKGQTRKQSSWPSREETFIAKGEISAVCIKRIEKIIDAQGEQQIICHIDLSAKCENIMSRIFIRIARIGEILSHMGPAEIGTSTLIVIVKREIAERIWRRIDAVALGNIIRGIADIFLSLIHI